MPRRWRRKWLKHTGTSSVIGVLLLVAGGISAAVALAGAQWALLLFGVMGALGAFRAWKLREVGSVGNANVGP